ASPGVPDTFQGTELWDFSLVDPDNRRPVDYERRTRLLGELCAISKQPAHSRAAAVRSMLDTLPDGRAKLLVIHTALALRRADPDLFQRGGYVPLWADSPHEQSMIAFARRFETRGLIVVAPRLLAGMVTTPGALPLGATTWRESSLALPWLTAKTT